MTETGRTADFLRHQEGESLIDSLVSEVDDEPPARAVERTELEEPVEQGSDSVLEQLVDAAPEPEQRATEVGSAPDAPKDVDESMIEGLLGGDQDSDGSRPA